jgi:hypothetical protein
MTETAVNGAAVVALPERVLDQVADGVAVFDADWGIRYANLIPARTATRLTARARVRDSTSDVASVPASTLGVRPGRAEPRPPGWTGTQG